MDRECKACGKWFTADNAKRKYCDDCRGETRGKRNKTTRMLSKYDNATMQSIKRYGTGKKYTYKTRVCEFCGKEYVQYPPLGSRFCSDKCNDDYNASKVVCCNCGRKLLPLGIRIVTNNIMQNHYCSAECEQEYKFEQAKKKGKLKKCPNCGKLHIKLGTYCCNDCYRASLLDGSHAERSKAKILEEKSKEKFIARRCQRCGDIFETSSFYIDKYGFPAFCEKCRDKIKKERNKV